MLQETSTTAAAAGGSNAEALNQMSFVHLVQNLDFVGWVVLITLTLMSVLSVYWIVMNLIKNTAVAYSIGLTELFFEFNDA